MKKTMIVLGAFTLLVAAPTFAQKETQKATKLVKAENVKVEKVASQKGQTSNEKLAVEPKIKTKESVERKVMPKRNVRKAESIEMRSQKSNTLIRKEESK